MSSTILDDEYFSGTKPDLINNKTIKVLDKMLDVPYTPKNKIKSNFICSFYENYIESNLFPIFVIIIFALFLIYKYYAKDLTKKKKKKKKENFLPTFNSYYPTDMQNPYVNYLPDTIPQKVGDEYLTYNDINPPIKYPQKYPPIPNKIREYEIYTGIENTYKNAQDPNLPNALGLPSNYNTTTEEAMEFMTSKNKKNLDALAGILFENPSPGNISQEEWENNYNSYNCYYS